MGEPAGPGAQTAGRIAAGYAFAGPAVELGSVVAPADAAAVEQAVTGSPLQAEYGRAVDRESAYERLAARLATPAEAPASRRQERRPDPEPDQGGLGAVVTSVLGSSATKSFLRSAATVLGREITRGMLGTARRRR